MPPKTLAASVPQQMFGQRLHRAVGAVHGTAATAYQSLKALRQRAAQASCWSSGDFTRIRRAATRQQGICAQIAYRVRQTD